MAINDERERESRVAQERGGDYSWKRKREEKKQMRREKGSEKERERERGGAREKQPSKRRVRDTTTLAQRELRDPPFLPLLYTCSPRN